MKLSNFIVDFLRLEPLIFCSKFIAFLVKIEMEKNKYLFKKNT